MPFLALAHTVVRRWKNQFVSNVIASINLRKAHKPKLCIVCFYHISNSIDKNAKKTTIIKTNIKIKHMIQPNFTELLMTALPLGAFLSTLLWMLMLWVTDKSNNDLLKGVIIVNSFAIICGVVGFIIEYSCANQYKAYEFYKFLAKVELITTAISTLALVLLIRKYKKNKKAQE